MRTPRLAVAGFAALAVLTSACQQFLVGIDGQKPRRHHVVTWSGRCRVAQLRVRQGPDVGEATGQHTLLVELVNRSHVGCVVKGYPVIRLIDRQGNVQPFRIAHSGDQMVTDRKPRMIPLPPRATAFVMLNQYRCDLGGITVSRELQLGLPGRRRASLAVATGHHEFTYCGRGDPGSVLHVSPIGASFRDVSAH
jgi:hypothetical protein